MSALAGILNFNNEPLRDEQWEQLLILWNGLEERGPDGGEVIVKNAVGMCYRAFHTNRESRLERQPLIGINGEVLVGDLRIDNRDELIAKLRGLLRSRSGEITDIELIMAAYQRWGETFPLHLVGEFALVLYDLNSGTALLARDHIGARPLHYHYDKHRLIWSSELAPLLDVAAIPLQVNEEFIAGYLMYDPEPELTAYKNIHSVKPFHVVIFSCDGQLTEKVYWDLGRIKSIRYKHEREYDDEFNFHFSNAVRAPLRSDRPVFSDLSGGLDSSSIVCIAHQAIKHAEVQAPNLVTVSLVSSGSPTSDQRKYIRHVEERIGQTGHYIDENDYPLLSTISEDHNSHLLNPLLFCEAKHSRINELMRDSDARCLLSGVGGDEIACSYTDPTPELADLLVSIKLLRLHRRLKTWSQKEKKPYFNLVWKSLVLPLLTPSFQARHQLRRIPLLPPFFNPEFVAKFNLQERIFARSPFECRLPSARDQVLGFWTAIRGIAAGHRRQVTYGNISYPFLARPLVEYMQAIPHDQLVQPAEGRRLMRRALQGIVPDKILQRKGKGNPEEVILRAFVREWPRLRSLFKDPRISLLGYVDNKSFVSAVEEYRGGNPLSVGMLLKLLSLEMWFRGLDKQANTYRINQKSSGVAFSETKARQMVLKTLTT
jgi:asparagine synthetase B (glutamine-hydrolysing)